MNELRTKYSAATEYLESAIGCLEDMAFEYRQAGEEEVLRELEIKGTIERLEFFLNVAEKAHEYELECKEAEEI